MKESKENYTVQIGSQVVKEANRGEYWSGEVTKLRGDKALVLFTSRGFARWCNLSNLELVYS